MSTFALKTASRAVLRRSPHLTRRPHNTHIIKRHSTNSSRPKIDSEPGTSIPVPTVFPTVPLWQRLGPLSRAFQAYGRAQRSRPYATQFGTSLVIYFCGDLSAQYIGGQEYDPKRTLRSLAIGAVSSIPSYKWFMFLGNHFNYSSHLLSLATKIVVNQVVFTPIFNTYFFAMQALLAGASLEGTASHIARTVPISITNSVKFWPAVTAFNFTFISAEYRSVFAGVVAIGWQTYLSYLNRKAEDEAKLLNARPGPTKVDIEARDTKTIESSAQKIQG